MNSDIIDQLFGGGFDPTTVKDSGNVLPEGAYRVKIVKTETKTSKKGHAYASFELDVFHPFEFQGRKLWDNLNLGHPDDKVKAIAMQRLKQYAEACGLAQVKSLGDFLGRDVVAVVKVTKDDTTGDQQNNIRKITAFVKGSGSATPPAGPATAGADVDPF